MLSSMLHIGTSGWSYKHWKDIFYPKDVKPEKYLEYYTTVFRCVELNSCFYNLLLSSTVKGWSERTPSGFIFCPKMSRLITHQFQLADCEFHLYRFMDVFEGLKDRLGPVLIQLPPGLYYNKQLIIIFFELLREKHHLNRFAVEARNKSWFNDEFFGLLAKYKIALVIADSGGRYPLREILTTDFVYLRFHGGEQLYASDYPDNDLQTWSEKIRNWMHEGKEVWAFFNNDYNGFAVKNALRLSEYLSSGKQASFK
jgi:uncharacterized protein YecE (DUF72 family)